MAFVTEDGTGLENANSYVSVAFADAYFADRNVVAWDGTQQDKQAALIKATDYIDNRFKFKGVRNTDTQALEFPRDNKGLPEKLRRATAEYALRALTKGELAPDPESAQQIISKTETLGPLTETTQFSATTTSVLKPYPAADMLLQGLTRPRAVVR